MEGNRKYLVKILPAEGCNPEFYPDEEMQTGMIVNGVALMSVKDGSPYESILYGINTLDMAKCMMGDGNEFRQAAAVAEGMRRALDIRKENPVRRLHSLLGMEDSEEDIK